MKIDAPVNGYDIDVMVIGYPGKTVCHGGLGWSTIVLLRGHGRVAMIDTGGMGVRRHLIDKLKERGLQPEDVTDLLLSHAHYDHILNWTTFQHARIVIGARGTGLGGEGALGPHAGARTARPRVAGLEDAAGRCRRRRGDARHHGARHARPHARPPLLPDQGQGPRRHLHRRRGQEPRRVPVRPDRHDLRPCRQFSHGCGNLDPLARPPWQYCDPRP